MKDRIEHQKTAYKWDFQFLAANQDAFATGESMGLDKGSCMNFVANAAGVNMLCARMSNCLSNIRKPSDIYYHLEEKELIPDFRKLIY